MDIDKNPLHVIDVYFCHPHFPWQRIVLPQGSCSWLTSFTPEHDCNSPQMLFLFSWWQAQGTNQPIPDSSCSVDLSIYIVIGKFTCKGKHWNRDPSLGVEIPTHKFCQIFRYPKLSKLKSDQLDTWGACKSRFGSELLIWLVGAWHGIGFFFSVRTRTQYLLHVRWVQDHWAIPFTSCFFFIAALWSWKA